MGEPLPQTGPGGVLTAEVAGRVRIDVQEPEADGKVCFSVLRYSARTEGGSFFAGTGTDADVRAAIAAAEDMAGEAAHYTRDNA